MPGDNGSFISRIASKARQWLRGNHTSSRPSKQPPQQVEGEAEVTQTIHDWVSRRVREGFETREQIIATVVEVVEDQYSTEGLEPAVTRATDEALAEHRRQQASWTRPTDCDRLDAAFSHLEERGIVARQNFTCCQNCGHAEIGEEIEKFAQSRTPVGYTFYHMQDTEQAREYGTLYLAYRSLEGKPKADVGIAAAVCEALREQGLNVEWDGSASTRICVTGITWQKYRE